MVANSVFMCRLFITATELEEWCRLYITAQAPAPRMVQVVQRCTGMSVSLVGFGHEGWFLQQAVQLCFGLLGGQVVQRCPRQSLESQAVQHCWSLHLVTSRTALLVAVQSNSGTGAALGCRPSALHLPAFVGLSSFVGGPDVARFLEDMWPASVVRKSIRLRQIFTASTSVGCNSCTESTMKDAGCPALLS